MTIFNCPYCGEQFKVKKAGFYKCPHCQNIVEMGLGIVRETFWENRGGANIVRAFYETWKKIMSAPIQFFRRTKPRDAMMLAIYYGLICQSLALFISWVYEVGFSSIPVIYGWVATFGGWSPFEFMGVVDISMQPYYLLVVLVVSPFFAALGIIVTAFLYHICLMILGAANNGFVATVKAVSYGSTPQLLMIVPIIGPMVATVWSIILTIIGLKELHNTTYGRVIFAVLLPILLCCGFIIFVAAFMMGLLMEGAFAGGNFSV